MDATYDAVVVGAGPNGLVAANRLADAGWSVLVLESTPHVGGAVHSDRSVDPAFEHDTFSSFYPLGLASPAMRSLHLEEHGLVWTHAPAVLGHQLPEGDWALLHRDRDVTASLLDALSPGDGEAWLSLCRRWDRIGDVLVEALLTPLPPLRATARGLVRLRSAGGLDLVRMLLSPASDETLWPFTGDAPRLLIAGNAGHSDIPMDAPGSGLMGLLLTMLGQTVGFPVPEGGAGSLSGAMVRRFVSRGGRLECGAAVTGIVVRGGRAVAVRTADGREIDATRAVVADVVAPSLYLDLVGEEHIPQRYVTALERFEYDDATVKVDWALKGPVPWTAPGAHGAGTVHLGGDMTNLAIFAAQLKSGVVPHRPFMIFGQMTTTDPTRSPSGTETAWAYTHVPFHVRSDAGGDITGKWDDRETDAFAARIEDAVERVAPGFKDLVIGRHVFTPRTLEAANANLVHGAVNGGTAQIHQQLVFRPVPGLGRPETPVKQLYLASSSAHPGGGVHGACGANAARVALRRARLPRPLA